MMRTLGDFAMLVGGFSLALFGLFMGWIVGIMLMVGIPFTLVAMVIINSRSKNYSY